MAVDYRLVVVLPSPIAAALYYVTFRTLITWQKKTRKELAHQPYCSEKKIKLAVDLRSYTG